MKKSNGRVYGEKEIILIRHGETESSLKGTFCGNTDVHLNKRGRQEIDDLPSLLHRMQIKREILTYERSHLLYTSPLIRAVESSTPIEGFLKMPAIADKRLAERNFGIFENMTTDDIIRIYPTEYKSWTEDWADYKIMGGESARQVFVRVQGYFEEICRKEEKSVVIVTHSGIIRQTLAYLLGMGLEGIWRFKVDTGSFTRVVVDEYGYAFLTHMNLKPE